MRNFQEIFQNLKPLISWRGWWRREKRLDHAPQARSEPLLQDSARSRKLTLARPERPRSFEWRLVEDSRLVRRTFNQFRELMYKWNGRTRQQAGDVPRALWESGKLAGGRGYFFLQPWNDRGYLFEETNRGWMVARAEKIATQSQFVRDRLAWDQVLLHEAADRPGLLRVSSERMGEGLVSLALYEDFMSQAFRSEA